MPAIAQKVATRGSQKWLQCFVRDNSAALDAEILKTMGLSSNQTIEWLSPLAPDYAEFRDEAFIEKLIAPKILPFRPLHDFWPAGGPQWDALARSSKGDLILVEAKAHVTEMASPASAASEKSLKKIRASMDETRKYLGVSDAYDWTGKLYQYANRLAHLYLLRVSNGLPAHLVFLYFIGDTDIGGPETLREWDGAIALTHAILGLPHRHKLAAYVHDVFIDIKSL